MIQTIEAAIDESGQVHFYQPLTIKGVHRALVTILDEPPAQYMQPVLPAVEPNDAEPKELFGLWRDSSETESVDGYLRNLRKGRF